jgi:uncharacterized protein YcaQ
VEITAGIQAALSSAGVAAALGLVLLGREYGLGVAELIALAVVTVRLLTSARSLLQTAQMFANNAPGIDVVTALIAETTDHREVTRRHLGAFGPAARADLARWWSVQPARAGRMLQALGEEVAEVDVEGTPGWMLREHADEAAAEEPPERLVRLLPGFDMWVIGAARDAAALLDPAEKERVYRNQGWISPVLLVNGRMDGVWKHERRGRRLAVTVELFGKLPKWACVELQAEAERLASFLGGELELSWSR